MTDLPIVWERDLHQAADPRSIIAPSLLVIAERDTKICRVSSTDGSAMWVANVRKPWGWLAHSDSICAYLNQHSLLQCFGIEDGTERWAIDLAGRHGSTFGFVTIVADRVIVGGWRGYTDVVALDAEDGSISWTLPMTGRGLLAPLAGPDGSLLLPVPTEGHVVVVDATAGTQRDEWHCPCPDEVPDASPFVIAHGDRYVCMAPDGCVAQFRQEADRSWEVLVQHKRPISSLAPAFTDSLIAFEDVGGNLCGYSIDALTELWETPVQHRRRDLLPVAELPSGSLAFGAASGHLHLLHPDGYAVARAAVGKRFRAGLTHTPDGTIIGAAGGRLMAFDARAF